MPPVRRTRTLARSLLVALFVVLVARLLILAAVTPDPPAFQVHTRAVEVDAARHVRRVGASWARMRAGIRQVHLQGTPEEIGDAHARLLRPEMIQNERALWDVFQTFVPTRPLRTVVIDIARLRFSGLDASIEYARRAELAAAAQAFRPDPFENQLPTYARFLMLNALYDVSLSFEHSPLIGCSSVFVSGASGPLLGRNFDFEAHEVFDREKAVLVFSETGKIPVLSVAWPGLSGVVTGMNAEGVAAVVHGARAGSPSASGQPVLLTLREALANASTADAAAKWLADRQPIVSHMILVADAAGRSLVVERVPGAPAYIRVGAERLALSNHLEGPSAHDPANLRVRETTSTLARRKRLDVLLQDRSVPLDEPGLLRILRDHRDSEGRELPRGDRRAIDADIATHGVVMNLRERTIWVSQGPHLSGQFVRFDLARWVTDPEAESRREGWQALP